MNFKKPPEGGGARGWILNGPEPARPHLHFWSRNWGKSGKQSAMVKIMLEIYVLFINDMFCQTEENVNINAYRNRYTTTREIFILFAC